MSQQSAMQFVTRASQDPALYQSVMSELAAEHGTGDLANLTDAHFETGARLAAASGYDVSPHELKQALTEFAQEHPQGVGRELSDAELDLVAGGNSGANNVNPASGKTG